MTLINLSIGLLISLLSINHEYHVGIYHFYVKDKGIQISQKLFIDDFEKALYLSGKAIKIEDDLNDEKVSKALQNYILDHFSLSSQNDEIALTYVGAEWDDYHTIYVYWEVLELPENIHEISIENTIFLEVSNDQQNMHHIHIGEKEQSLLLERTKTSGKVKIN